ncbi:MAG TPA: ParB/RepB/Spo0J family partition protein [Bryobacteraceae bacterium]|nr:ParB/RepB/Spo0J family partition protein [Bryobacteraceae bacterium]
MNSANDKQRKALGKGLSALLPGRGQANTAGVATAAAPVTTSRPGTLPLNLIQPNPMQPRTVFHPDGLQELAASIRANGIIQPLIVRQLGDSYQIVAGERRWRAARLAELQEVPVIVQDVADRSMLELALIENIQREDLNPIETAHAFERLARDLGLSQEEIGRRTGKDRTSIANIVRLLKLPKEVQLLVAERRLSMGHARAILGLATAEEQIHLAEKAVALGLSVRQVEAQVQEITSDREKPAHSSRKDSAQDPNVRAAAEELERALGTRVRIIELSDQRGRIEIEYYSQADLDRLYQQIVGER